uniref:EF-hand domain-containing protein n=1 Tax=Catharus ustulatus TaxID=91951 RepID=A0A8C3URR6_CATUS
PNIASKSPPKIPKKSPKNPDLKTDGFGLDTCRSMVAVMDSDTTGKLGFEEFKYLWNNIKKWQCVYKQFDSDRSGTIGPQELPGAFQAAGRKLGEIWDFLGFGGGLVFWDFFSGFFGGIFGFFWGYFWVFLAIFWRFFLEFRGSFWGFFRIFWGFFWDFFFIF